MFKRPLPFVVENGKCKTILNTSVTSLETRYGFIAVRARHTDFVCCFTLNLIN